MSQVSFVTLYSMACFTCLMELPHLSPTELVYYYYYQSFQLLFVYWTTSLLYFRKENADIKMMMGWFGPVTFKPKRCDVQRLTGVVRRLPWYEIQRVLLAEPKRVPYPTQNKDGFSEYCNFFQLFSWPRHRLSNLRLSFNDHGLCRNKHVSPSWTTSYWWKSHQAMNSCDGDRWFAVLVWATTTTGTKMGVHSGLCHQCYFTSVGCKDKRRLVNDQFIKNRLPQPEHAGRRNRLYQVLQLEIINQKRTYCSLLHEPRALFSRLMSRRTMRVALVSLSTWSEQDWSQFPDLCFLIISSLTTFSWPLKMYSLHIV